MGIVRKRKIRLPSEAHVNDVSVNHEAILEVARRTIIPVEMIEAYMTDPAKIRRVDPDRDRQIRETFSELGVVIVDEWSD